MLKNEHNLTEKQYIHFEKIMASDLQTAKAWYLAESFRVVFESLVIEQAYAYFDMWVSHVKESGIAAMQKVAKTFMNHITGIVNYVKHRITNAKTERFNGKIQNIKNVARGYRSFKNFRSAILFFNGKLDLYSHKFQ